ncbi:MAG: hypothetical protein V4640_15690 [Verrucomicrobiota bacterium]
MKLSPTSTFAALILIGVGGFFAGRISSKPAVDEKRETPTEARSTRSLSASAAAGPTDRPSAAARPSGTRATSSTERLARLESILRGENALDRNRALLDFIDQLAPGEFEEAVASFRALGITENRMGEYSLLLTAWAKVDPTSALAYAQENTGNGFARNTILTAWATQDPEAAIRWAEANFDGDGANPYLAGIIRGLAGTDPAKATALLAQMPRSGERGQGLDFLLPHLLQQGADATQAWIDSLQDESLKNGAMVRTARELADKNPAATAAWLIANPGEAQQRRMDDVYGVWAAKDTQAALASFSALPAGDSRSNALRGIVSAAAVNDPKEAVSLMDQYPADVTDRVVQNAVWHSFGKDPATAVSQIDRITDPGERDRTYRRTLSYWMDRDPASAQAWINNNPIPDPVRQALDRRASGG